MADIVDRTFLLLCELFRLLRWAGRLRIVEELDYVLGLPSQAD